jgi:hypothetical protein
MQSQNETRKDKEIMEADQQGDALLMVMLQGYA